MPSRHEDEENASTTIARTTMIRQASLAAAILLVALGTFVVFSPPNPGALAPPSTGDTVRRLHVVDPAALRVQASLSFFPALHHAVLVLAYPRLPSWLVWNGAENGLETRLLRWSWCTAVPVLLSATGILLRLASFEMLGENFTFALAEPDGLVTSGLYRYVQHPSYLGFALIMLGNLSLLGRPRGVGCCWTPPGLHRILQPWGRSMYVLALAVFAGGMYVRVRDEEQMLAAKFGDEWHMWHNRTARFVPGIF